MVTNFDKQSNVPADRQSGDTHNSGPLLNHAGLISELYNDFNRIGGPKASAINANDVDVFLKRPHLSEQQLEMGHFVKDNFGQLSKMAGTPGEIRQSDVDYMNEVFAQEAPTPPNAAMISASTVGGAIGGGGAAHFEGQPLGDGVRKGAVVGATIGIVAYEAEKAHYNNLIRDRGVADLLQYPNGRYTSDATSTDGQIYKMADKPISLDTASTTVEKFRKTLSQADFDGNGVVTSSELKEAIRSNYIPDDQKPLAAALIKNMDEVSKLNPEAAQVGITDSGLHQLALALQPDNHDALREALHHRNVSTGIGTGAVALWGGVIGGIVGNVPGAIIGASIGGAIGGTGGWFSTNGDVRDLANHENHLRSDVLKHTVHDLQYLP